MPLLLPWELKHEGVNRNAVASDAVQPKLVRNRVAVERLGYSLPRVAEAATLGFERQPLRGKTNLNESDVSLPLKIS